MAVIFNIFSIFLIMCVCTSMFGYVYIQVQVPTEVISECQITLELEFHATVIYLAWALGADL